jgi:hypothetical protein
MKDDRRKLIKNVNKKTIEQENEAWARFLYKQYKKKKLKESLSKQRESVE